MQEFPTIKLAVPAGQETFPKVTETVRHHRRQIVRSPRHTRARLEGIVTLTAAVGEMAMVVLGFTLAYWLRYHSGLFFAAQTNAYIWDYWKLILFGSAVVYSGMLSKNEHEFKNLLSPSNTILGFTFTLTICLFAFIGITLAVRDSNPPISRGFVIWSWFTVFLTIFCWRLCLSHILRHPAVNSRLRKRLLVVGTGPETLHIKQGLTRVDSEVEFVGWVEGSKPNRIQGLDDSRLGSLHELEEILKNQAIDVALLTESESLQREGVAFVAKICEREHVQFKMVPHFFEILISGLRPSVVGGVQVLGVDSLPLNSYANRIVKRTMDIVGGSLGLLLSGPLILFFGAMVYLESPGPIFYQQVRAGRHGRLFNMFKIRSMRLDAEAGGQTGWTTENDSRRLRIGTFMRKWNIDEIPQFWNVLKGDMSLIGPRPERPELIEQFKFSIPHYQTRHACRPGMSGWAQVHGWRGDTSLEKRINCDLWYVEKWNILLDFQIMFMTFFHRQNAY
jgi:exopolysaccharide biosynthesis polyprenyl glycosylphosphotransferase